MLIYPFRGVAQLAEHSTPNRAVAGSTPVSPASKTPDLWMVGSFYFVLKEHYQNNKQSYLDRVREVLIIEDNKQKFRAYLSEHPCVDCGQTDIRCLEFDHVRGNKTSSIATLLKNAASWSAIEAQIAKCEVRCANCHRIKTLERGKWWRFGLVE